jgi:hypothetical protein
LAESKAIPTLDELLSNADILIQQYVSLAGYKRVLSTQNQRELKKPNLKVKLGKEWVSQSVTSLSSEQLSDNGATKDNEGFDGDRSLANSILFKTQFTSWLLLEYTIKDGDIGRVLEQLKVILLLSFVNLINFLNYFRFGFSCSQALESSHQQYASYLLELHCLLEYESSPALRKTILNNYLVKFGLRFKERDLMQEDHNGKIQGMVPKGCRDFDDPYHRNIITPNINHLIQIDRNFETGFSLKHWTTSHTSPGM